MNVFRSIKWALGLLLVFGLIIATNLIDKNNYLQVKNAVTTIYEDRLVVDHIVYEMTNLIYEKELSLARKDSTFFIENGKKNNRIINEHIDTYASTQLTKKEKVVFDNLKNQIKILQKQELAVSLNFKDNYIDYKKTIIQIKDLLFELSNIQLEEGKRQLAISNKAIETIDLFTKIEIYMLIFLAIVIQVIVIYQPKKEREE